MKKAFTLLELIFVILIIGIISSVGFSSFKPKYLIDDVNFIATKIKETQFLGTGYEHNSFGVEEITPDYSNGCIDLKKSSLNESATTDNKMNYILHVTDENNNEFDYGTICFDSKGRPHDNNFTNGSLLSTQKVLRFKYSNKEKNITIEPITGYVIISK